MRAIGGAARVLGNEVRAPQIEVKNTSQKTVRSIDMGWIVRDERGRDFVAGSVPAALQLGPVQTGRMTEAGTLRFSHPAGQADDHRSIDGVRERCRIRGWQALDSHARSISSEATSDPILRRALATSPEQQRLAEIYRRKGISGLADELKRVN